MNRGWRYRIAAVVGTSVITALAVVLVNNEFVISLVTLVPVLRRLPVDPPHGDELVLEMLTSTALIVAAFVPLYKPHPRRILDVVSIAGKRVLLAMIGLAAIGYFDYTYRLPRLTVLLVTPFLLVALPAWFVYIRRRPYGPGERVIIVGDDLELIRTFVQEISLPLLGYLAPFRVFPKSGRWKGVAPVTDGGIERLGGLSRLEDVLVDYEVDTVYLAFRGPDRAEFFGTLSACYEHGVAAKVHRDHADAVLIDDEDTGPFVDVVIEPWDVQDYILKRAFDIIFAIFGLIVSLPVVVPIAFAIKSHDAGPILYRQERTAVFGETFEVVKFRTMSLSDESIMPMKDVENSRITRVGRFLRRTHLDEIPQLWSILHGEMSVVGPRAVWTAEESLLEEESKDWRKRWFVKPGLTGLAQVRGAESTDPEQKIRLDLEYVQRQSFGYDLKIVVRQLWKTGMDLFATTRGNTGGE